jgi:hypothetical protein
MAVVQPYSSSSTGRPYNLQTVAHLIAKAKSATSYGDYIKKVAGMTLETYTIQEMSGRPVKVFSALAAMVESVEQMKEAAAESMRLKLHLHDFEHVNRATAAAEGEG